VNHIAPPTTEGQHADLRSEEHALGSLPPGLVQEWQRLTAESGSGSLFASSGFVHSFAAAFGDRVKISVLTLRSPDKTLQGLVPLMRARLLRGPSLNTRYVYQMTDFAFLKDDPRRVSVPVAQLSTPLGLEATSLRSELLARPGMRQTVLRALPRAFGRLGGWNVAVMVLDDADALALREGRLPAAQKPLNREMKFLRDVRPAAALVALQSQKFRQNVRRSEKFAQDAGAEFEVLRGFDAVSLAMDEFADLAGRSWKATDIGGRSETEEVFIPFTGRQRRFFELLIASGEAEPVMVAARIDARMVSAMLMLLHHRRLFTLLIFNDLEHSRLGLGRQVLHSAIDFAHEEKVVEVDYNSNAIWTVPYADHISVRSNVLLMAPTIGGRWRSLLARRFART
jgi:hypothetical protein